MNLSHLSESGKRFFFLEVRVFGSIFAISYSLSLFLAIITQLLQWVLFLLEHRIWGFGMESIFRIL